MKWMVALALGAMIAGGPASADETQPQTPAQTPAQLPLKLPPHAQPAQREINSLPEAYRAKLGVDTSTRDQKEVDELYRELTHQPPANAPQAPPSK